MNLKMNGKNMELDEKVREYVQRKIDRLSRLYNRIIGDVNVEFSRQKNRVKAEVTLFVPQALIRAENEGVGPTEAFDLMMDKLERQLRKYKKLRKERRRDAVSLRLMNPESSTSGEEETIETPEIVRWKIIDLKPMPPEEAVHQMELLGHDFFLFLNSQTDKLNVVYRRKDGKFGILTPS